MNVSTIAWYLILIFISAFTIYRIIKDFKWKETMVVFLFAIVFASIIGFALYLIRL